MNETEREKTESDRILSKLYYYNINRTNEMRLFMGGLDSHPLYYIDAITSIEKQTFMMIWLMTMVRPFDHRHSQARKKNWKE